MAITVTIPDGLVEAIKQLPRTDSVGFGSFISTDPKHTAANLVRLIDDAERAQGQTHSYGDGCEPAHDAVEHAHSVLRTALSAADRAAPDWWINDVVRNQLSFKPAVHLEQPERSCQCGNLRDPTKPFRVVEDICHHFDGAHCNFTRWHSHATDCQGI